jgi:7-methyl-GTP pyrophosphatase
MSDPFRRRLVLASTSRYRRELLARLGVPFETTAPNVDECPAAGEMPQALALRLACAKAQAAQAAFPDALIIGCDQIAAAGATLLNKPGTHARAVEQLKLMSGKQVVFFTALCLLNALTSQRQTAIVPVTVHMRELSTGQIERYLQAEQPYDCAGAARIEGLGITLVARLDGDDPNALIGLPLIKLCDMLRNEGIELP